MRELQAIQNDINMMDQAIQNAGVGVDVSSWQSEKDKYEREFVEATAYWEGQKTIEQRVEEEVQSNGYALDTMEVDGLTAPEIITDDSQYKLIRKGVQVLIVGMNLSQSTALKAMAAELSATKECVNIEALRADQMQSNNKDLEVANYQIGLENDELKEKVRKGAELAHELNQQLEQKNQHIQDLQNQIAIGVRGALNVVDIPQDTSKMAAEIIARKVRITNVRFSDVNGISTRFKKAENVLTGETIEYEGLYEKRYIILDPKEAEQYRADEATHKAEIEAQNTVIPVMDPPDEPVEELVADAEPQPIHEEVQATVSQGDSTDLRDSATHEVVEQPKESEVITLESLDARLKALELKLAA